MTVIEIIRGYSHTVEKGRAYSEAGQSGAESRYRVESYDKYRNSIVLHTYFLSVDNILELCSILCGALVL